MTLDNGENMVIALRAYLDKIEGFRNESFQNEELLLVINKSMYRLFDDIVDKNHQQGTVRFEWARRLQASAETATSPILWDGTQTFGDLTTAQVDLPSDMYYLIAARAEVTISTENYSRNRTSEDCLNAIPYPPTTIANAQTEFQQLQMMETGTVSDKEINVFYGKDYQNPRAELLEDNVLRLFRGPNFIVTNVVYDYYIEPTEIENTSTAIGEWPESALQKIVDYSVEYLRLSIEDPAWQANVQDFDKRTHNSTIG